MKTSEFDYSLPPHLIAQTPIEPRDASRLLVVSRADGRMTHRTFRDVVEYLRAGDLLVFNDTRVIPARLRARKVPTGGKVELLLVARGNPTEWEALVKGRKAMPGQRIAIGEGETRITGQITAVTKAGGRLITFNRPLEPLLDDLGKVPLPPYIHEPLADPERYQTVYARLAGSSAAPTAGLHFTPDLLLELRDAGVGFAFVTLHISMDTFRPVTTEYVKDHIMHTEWCSLSLETAQAVNQARLQGERIVAVGTTAVRVLESAAAGRLSPSAECIPSKACPEPFALGLLDPGAQGPRAQAQAPGTLGPTAQGRRALSQGQSGLRVPGPKPLVLRPKDAGDQGQSRRVEGLETDTHDEASCAPESDACAWQTLAPFEGHTDLFIHPGYHFRAVDVLITNFHLPRSTLLMLVSAFADKELIDRAYREAIIHQYRFYSFGDAMLII